MRRLLFAAAPLMLLLGAACGDGDTPTDPDTGDTTAEDATAGPTVSEADAARTEVAKGLEQPTVADKPLPTATPVPDDRPLFQAVAGSTQFTPTRAEFAALATVQLSAGGQNYTGVPISAIAEKVAGRADGTVTIEGTRVDNLRFGVIRFPLTDIAESTVLVLDEQGHILLASSSIPQDQWLKVITGIAFN